MMATEEDFLRRASNNECQAFDLSLKIYVGPILYNVDLMDQRVETLVIELAIYRWQVVMVTLP